MVEVVGTRRVNVVTGEHTHRFGIHGTDLGILWDNGQGKLLVAFGDTYNEHWGGHEVPLVRAADWRCNVLATSTDRDLDQGLNLDGVVAREDGTARQFIESDHEVEEVTTIPNSGIAVDGYNYVQYMSVRKWRPDGWDTNYGGIAVSADGGTTWTKPKTARWPNTPQGDDPFQICAFATDSTHVYLVGTTNGRFGDAYLARCRKWDVLTPSAYEYWTGDWGPGPATPVMSGPVGELSVTYNQHFGMWLAMHLDETRAAIVLRTAPELTGPWTDGQVLVSGRDVPALYGGYFHPWGKDGTAVYWTLSQWGPYNVSLMRTDLA
jgi:hypothetical protein